MQNHLLIIEIVKKSRTGKPPCMRGATCAPEKICGYALARKKLQSTSGRNSSHLMTPSVSFSNSMQIDAPICCPIEHAFLMYPIVVPHLMHREIWSLVGRLFKYSNNSFITRMIPQGILTVNTSRLFTFRYLKSII